MSSYGSDADDLLTASDNDTSDDIVDDSPNEDENFKVEETHSKSNGLGTRSILLAGNDDEDEDEQEEDDDDAPQQGTSSTTHPVFKAAPTTTSEAPSLVTVIPHIIIPSPFQHHNTSDRYRNALSRVQASPTRDTEAWQAIMNECSQCYRSQLIPAILNTLQANQQQMANGITMTIMPQDELERKLDWVESCHGHLLQFFPFAATYYVSLIEMLLLSTAIFPGEELDTAQSTDGVSVPYWRDGMLTEHQVRREQKINSIFRIALGVEMDGSPAQLPAEDTTTSLLGGMCSSSIELWLLYIRKRSRDAHRYVAASTASEDGKALIRNWTAGAYETALAHGAAFVPNNHLLWKQYLSYVKSWVPIFIIDTVGGGGLDHILIQQQMQTLRSIYQRIVTIPMTGLDALWMEYEQIERSQSEQLAQALIGEFLPKYQHARSVYLERNRVYNVHELRVGRLATPPVDLLLDSQGAGNIAKESGVAGGTGVVGSSGLGDGIVIATGAGMADGSPAGGSANGNVVDYDDYKAKMKEESMILAKWRRRCGYERTNPERLTLSDLTVRVRQSYKDAICAFMRHPEVWHEWSSWELLHTGEIGCIHTGADNVANARTLFSGRKSNTQYAIAVLELAERHIPDCTLLAYTHAQILECQPFYQLRTITRSSSLATAGEEEARSDGTIMGEGNPAQAAIDVMNRFCDRAGNTLSYILLQQLVRKHKGVKEAREVFAKARRVLRLRKEDVVDRVTVDNSGKDLVAAIDKGGALTADVGSSREVEISLGQSTANGVRRMVTNRLSLTAGLPKSAELGPLAPIYTRPAIIGNKNDSLIDVLAQGYITWHLYASHATIEHRLNNFPHIAARIYELGLRKHRTFLSTPQYVLQYASLLLELNDEENLRALLTRAVAACEEESALENIDSTDVLSNDAQNRREAQRPLWDTMLKFESTLSLRSGDSSTLQAVEARRRRALFGPMIEDVVGGTAGNMGDDGEVGLGANKTSLSETLIRMDGYDVSSRIANGMNRLVELLQVTGILDDGGSGLLTSTINFLSAGSLWKDNGVGGLSDASFRRRLRFQRSNEALAATSANYSVIANGAAAVSAAAAGGANSTAGKFLSAKERYMAQSTVAHQANLTGVSSLQASPEWLRALLLMLPSGPRGFRGAVPLTKPPPHIIEMALAALRNNSLPSTRPIDDGTNSFHPLTDVGSVNNNTATVNSEKKKRTFDEVNNNGDDSSDEENEANHRGGYGRQFRSRQRARMMATSYTNDGVGASGGDTSSGVLQ